jgi:hypothetical protein
LALATAATAVAVGLTVTSGGGIPAFAVTEASDGTVTITITDYRDTAQLTAELKRLDLPAAVVYVPADEYCYQAHADLVRQPANGQFTVGFGAIGSKTGITITFRTRLLRPGQSIIFGIGDYVRNGVVLDAAGTYVVTGQPTSCQYHSSDRLVFPAPGPGHSAPPATKAPVIAYVDGNVRFPNSLGLSGK